MLSDATGAAEGYEAEERHHQRVDDCETDQPEDRARFPLPPCGEDAEAAKMMNIAPGEFVENLACDAPEGAESHACGAPEGREHVARAWRDCSTNGDFGALC